MNPTNHQQPSQPKPRVRLFTFERIGEALGVSARTVKRWAASGKIGRTGKPLPLFRDGEKVYAWSDEIIDWQGKPYVYEPRKKAA